MIQALISQADAERFVQQSRAQVKSAVRRGAERLLFFWQAPDDREVVLRIYYVSGSLPEILALEVIQIEERAPSVQQRAEFEVEFDSRLHDYGSLWLQVASEIWQRWDTPM